MSNNQHTPGPWEIDGNEIFAEGDYFVARVNANQYTPNTDKRKAVTSRNWSMAAQDEANARLIAAAPDLLNALRGLIAAYGGDRDYSAEDNVNSYESAIALIDRIEGGAE
jgi:hypothetical protein